MTCAPRCYRTVNTRLCLEKHMVTSPHSIAMPNMLYFTAVVFLSFFLHFSTPNIRGHWTDLNQTWTYIHLWLLFEQVCPNSPCHLPHSPAGGQKNDFGDRLWNLTEHISAKQHDSNNRKESCQSTGTPLHVPKFGERWPRNGWERLPSFRPPLKFSHWETLPALPHERYNRQQANFATCYVVARAYRLE